ncbi:hypothetical protein [Flammeovirga sp. SJP92]|uniref:hypothetical protein n=1 Tax=Flammeovirga sp. SJP92 TaxID=1775430 RepID=UPI000788BEFD|nr:hypothetical protein [Flammeovirga sp. SJP92]KXX70783.1 hypothetical protein AVL50_07185 [Flammeovirga sp. SJP92]
MAGVYKEVWIGAVEKHMRADGSFLDEIPDKSSIVGNGVIHLTELGDDPQILIDNTVYPIATAKSDDDDVTIVLKKVETTNTEVTDDELYAISYDKMKEKAMQHGDTLSEGTIGLALHSLAPGATSAETPVIEATGADDGSGRNKLTVADIRTLKLKFDKAKIPKKGRVLVLCPEHVNDLLEVNEAFEKQYQDVREGVILKLHGFKIYETTETVYYATNNTKKSYGSVPIATDRLSSIAFYAPKCLKARGDGEGKSKTKMYYSESKNDPEGRSSKIGFRTYFVCIPKTGKYIGAIVSPQA